MGDIQYLWEGFSLLSKRNIQNPDCTVCNPVSYTHLIDQNKKPTAVSLAGVMRKGENEVGLLRFYKNVKYCILKQCACGA